MTKLERQLYERLRTKDERGDNNGLREAMFGTDEWAGVREAEWMDRMSGKNSIAEFEEE